MKNVYYSEPVATKLLEAPNKSKEVFHILPDEDKEQSQPVSQPTTRNGQTRNGVHEQKKDVAEESGFIDDPDVPPLM